LEELLKFLLFYLYNSIDFLLLIWILSLATASHTVWNLVANFEGGTQAEGVEESIWT
jgi:hypothetical protein